MADDFARLDREVEVLRERTHRLLDSFAGLDKQREVNELRIERLEQWRVSVDKGLSVVLDEHKVATAIANRLRRQDKSKRERTLFWVAGVSLAVAIAGVVERFLQGG